MDEATLTFKQDGTCEIQGAEGKPVERDLAWLFKGLGKVERRGHKHTHGRNEGLKQGQG